MLRIAPSILSANFACLEKQIRLAEAGKADWIHCDIMDGHFVPNITIGPLVVEALRRITTLPLDVHLMIQKPDDFLEQFIHAGAKSVSVHQETCIHLNQTVKRIKELGARAGVAIDPSTTVSTLKEIIADLDLVLIMSVNPGFGGQKFITESLQKIKQAAELIAASNSKAVIEVDGGIDTTTAANVVKAGASVLVVGNAIFSKKDIAGAVREIRKAAQV
ncbi:MAG: ribulose-phosphate 3-epimerase [Bacteroidota bacterium]